MLTVHRVRGVGAAAGDIVLGHAVVVDGARFAAVGPYEELLAAYGERARVRDWGDAILTSGRFEPDAVALLESAYWPDPREADDLGTAALTGAALATLDIPDTRWGASARRGVQRLLAAGTTALAGPFTHPSVRTAVARSGLRDHPVAPPEAGGEADFAVLTPDGTCLATSIGGRLVYRRR
ncbi:imidazolonepropionase-like domain-containing protein [Streptomyces flavofungini]|uniref:Aminodeoxyfutalosine deaminase/Imidazolonepropionase-like composite domain-containing protein n=1 Tax=Streptomyces flavofungini TaxID=68200 RepID=A0ABS0X6H1_9ACTN|nr:hypothetical protein [Streptomyces flavofungini]MBJ3808671.1 hypothetical protein [Streptomyces flavofungini]GHC70801.1 hypothetical protein GCM10010349_46900 [Streptomyces flavofungini]